ncbi:MAG: tRNA 2-thiouridine(34) synthase MnmA [Lachnospiraceae bacterium]|nr:tRNA 2-thiouridine(34) synthase MnmA [Lachnospiraceae bacterium]
MSKVLIGLSGGVDSAVAAFLLKEQGHDVIGVTLRTWDSGGDEESRCCEIDDARDIARVLDIPYHPFNSTLDFKEKVVDPFINDYIAGFTPNPCIECNPYVKWAKMMYYMQVLEADYVATGHYAYVDHLDNGRYTVRKALHAEKDQTYMLYKLTQNQLAHTLMPLGDYSKDQVREIAARHNISVANKPDSQEICFVPDDDYCSFIRCHAGNRVPGEGNFVDEEGNVLGRHKGIIHYTIGQRKGLGIAFGRPLFVKKIDAEKNEVVLSDNDSLFSYNVLCDRVNYLSIEGMQPGETLRCKSKIRYRHEAADATLRSLEGGKLAIEFDQPVRAATPGQSAVFYDDADRVIGGGRIIG